MKRDRRGLVTGIRNMVPLLVATITCGVLVGIIFRNFEMGLAIGTTLAGSIGILIG